MKLKPIPLDPVPTPEDYLEWKEAMTFIQKALSRGIKDARRRNLVIAKFGLHKDGKELKLNELAKSHKISNARMQQLLRQAATRIRNRLALQKIQYSQVTETKDPICQWYTIEHYRGLWPYKPKEL